MNNLLKTAVGYCRVSSTGQLDGDGPERQHLAIHRFAADNGHSIAREFIDDISGTKDAKHRAAFEELLAYCSTHQIHHVIIEKSDRISRDMFIGLSIIGDCAARSLHLIDADTGRDLAHPKGPYEKFVIQILMAAAELNKNILVHNTGSARARSRKRGIKSEGRKGYRDSPKTPHGPDTIDRARRLRDQGITYQAIADLFNQTNTPTMTGVQYTRGIVHRMLNPKSEYAGVQA